MMTTILSVSEFDLDERIAWNELLYGKYDKATLIDNDLSYSFQFPSVKCEVYTE